MEQILDTKRQDFFSAMVSNPGQIDAAQVEQLTQLVGQYPHSGILRAMLAAASQTVSPEEFQQKLKTAAVYAPDRTALYNLINYPEKLLKHGEEFEPVTYIDEAIEEPAEEAEFEHDEVFEEITPIEDIVITHNPEVVAEQEAETLAVTEEPTITTEPVTYIDEIEEEEEAPANFDESSLEDVIFAQYAWAKDADIEADDIPTIIQLPSEEKKTTNQTEISNSATENGLNKQSDTTESPEKKNEFKFEIAGGESITEHDGSDLTVSPAFEEPTRISKYDDDKMPYTFLWWLDKVRKEYAGSHQPYVPFKPVAQEIAPANVPEELQQQYYENIFHVTTVEELDKNTIKPAVAIEHKTKEDEIIERFINEDPQIKPPTADKLDNENKARRSAEDSGELVSETLARIYLDQMLYHKAISTYQKLLLKFPEKSSYFVAQIKLLEKKIN